MRTYFIPIAQFTAHTLADIRLYGCVDCELTADGVKFSLDMHTQPNHAVFFMRYAHVLVELPCV